MWPASDKEFGVATAPDSAELQAPVVVRTGVAWCSHELLLTANREPVHTVEEEKKRATRGRAAKSTRNVNGLGAEIMHALVNNELRVLRRYTLARRGWWHGCCGPPERVKRVNSTSSPKVKGEASREGQGWGYRDWASHSGRINAASSLRT